MPFAQIEDIKMYYRVFRHNIEVKAVDDTLQTMIVMHGGPGLVDHQIELDAWCHFSEIIQLIFIDLRGCGQTEDGDLEQWSLKQCGEDLYQFCQKLNIEHPIVAGVSTGGYISMSYVINHPSHPKALIWCNTEAKASPEERVKAFLRFGSPEAGAAADALHNDVTDIKKAYHFFETCAPYMSKKPFTLIPPVRVNETTWLTYAKEWFVFDYREELRAKIRCPVLILAGENDPGHPLACAIETARYVPKEYLHFTPIKNTGAPVYQDQPEVFDKMVREFLKK